MAHKTFTFISDGGVQEEISQGAGRIAGYLGLSNLVMFYDSNDIQLSTRTEAVTAEDTAMKYEAWNWLVLLVDGNDPAQLYDALFAAQKEAERPTLIIGKTIMGKASMRMAEVQLNSHAHRVSFFMAVTSGRRSPYWLLSVFLS